MELMEEKKGKRKGRAETYLKNRVEMLRDNQMWVHRKRTKKEERGVQVDSIQDV